MRQLCVDCGWYDGLGVSVFEDVSWNEIWSNARLVCNVDGGVVDLSVCCLIDFCSVIVCFCY